jgi:hypothetical protein
LIQLVLTSVKPACVTATRAPSALIKRTTGCNRLIC